MDTSAQTDALVSLLRDEIFALRNGAHELFIAEPLGQFPRYVQGTLLGSGEVLLEVGSNRFLGDAPLDEAGLSALSELGWSPPDNRWPNHWRKWTAGQEGEAAGILGQTLRVILGVSTREELRVTHDDPDDRTSAEA